MNTTFEPRLDILHESQRKLWPELDAMPSSFVLYGGTALALQIRHGYPKISISSLRPALSRIRCSRSCRSSAISTKKIGCVGESKA